MDFNDRQVSDQFSNKTVGQVYCQTKSHSSQVLLKGTTFSITGNVNKRICGLLFAKAFTCVNFRVHMYLATS